MTRRTYTPYDRGYQKGTYDRNTQKQYNPPDDPDTARGYYQGYHRPKPDKIKITPEVDRALAEKISNSDHTHPAAYELGAWILSEGLDRQLLDKFGSEISHLSNPDGSWTIVAGQSDYTAGSPFEALLLMLVDR